MNNINSIIIEQLNQFRNDCILESKFNKMSKIINENVGDKIFMNITKLPLPNFIKKELIKSKKQTLTSAGLLTTIGLIKVSSLINKLYLAKMYPKCKKIKNIQAKKECVLQSKIKAKEKTIQHLKTLYGSTKKETIDTKILKLKKEIEILKKKSLNLRINILI